MAKSLTLHTRVEPEVKEMADAILNDLGISITEAFNMFLHQVIHYRGIPFDVRLPNAETVQAIREAEQGVGLHRCSSIEQLLEELKAD